MVQILPEVPSFGQQIGRGLGAGFSQGLGEALRGKQERAAEERKFSQQFEADKQNYDILQQNFGKKFADIWMASPQGAKTELTKTALEARSRGIDLESVLSGMPGQQMMQQEEPKQDIESYKLDTSGMTPKDVVSFKGNLRKENTPLWKESVDRLKGSRELERDIGVLDRLNKKGNLPKGLGKLLIDPETGAPYEKITAVKNMHPDVQMWVKTIARQATQAQAAFPGRVTNFDLQSYMRQFPNLFNTEEGRNVILKQMKLTNKAHELMDDAIQKVYAKHKLSGITPEDAENLAREMVQDKISAIDEELFKLAGEGEIFSSPEEMNASESGKRLIVYDQNGEEVGDIDASEIDQLPPGFIVR